MTTASAIATPIAEPYAAIPASAIKKIDLGIEYNGAGWIILFSTKYHNFEKLWYNHLLYSNSKYTSFSCPAVIDDRL